MSLASLTFKSLQTCTTPLSRRSLARLPHRCRSGMSEFGRRAFSEDKGESKPPGEGNGVQENKVEGNGTQGNRTQGNGTQGNGTQVDDRWSELTDKLKAKEAEVVDLTGRLRYLQADFLNLQRNAAREKEQTRDYAISRFASDLLETVDVLGIALKSVPASSLLPPVPPDSPDCAPSSPTPHASNSQSPKTHQDYLQELHTGVEMTHRLLLQTLFKYHVKPFDPTGDRFDPNLHEALYQAVVPGKEPGTILNCQKTGYKIKDRVLRAAQVGVAQDTS